MHLTQTPGEHGRALMAHLGIDETISGEPQLPPSDAVKVNTETKHNNIPGHIIEQATSYASFLATQMAGRPNLSPVALPKAIQREAGEHHRRGQAALQSLLLLIKRTPRAATTPHCSHPQAVKNEYIRISKSIITAGNLVPSTASRIAASIITEAASVETLTSTIHTLLIAFTLASQCGTVLRRVRGCIRTLLDRYGDRASLALSEASKSTQLLKTEADPLLSLWISQAESGRRRAPFTLNEWTKALHDERSTDIDIVDKKNGWATWSRQTTTARKKGAPVTILSQNFNGFFKRVRSGDWRMLHKHLEQIGCESPDIIFGSEIRGSPYEEKSTKIAARTLRLMLFAMGYTHVAWNWCVDNPHTHGTAIFSKIPWTKMDFGTADGLVDPQGRTITVHAAGIAAVCTYTPCSSMGAEDAAKDNRRYEYDIAYRNHFCNVQKEVGSRSVLGCGDYNVAPTERHVDRRTLDWKNLPSTKSWERIAHRTLLQATNLKNAAEGTSYEFDPTWSKEGPYGFCMTLDHVLVPFDDTLIHVKSFMVIQDKCGSDHNGVYATVAARDQQVAIAALNQPKMVEREHSCLLHKCLAHGKQTAVIICNLCHLHGCSSCSNLCSDAECLAKAAQAHVHLLRKPRSAALNECFGKCTGPWTQVCRPWPTEYGERRDTSKDHMDVVHHTLCDLREVSQADHLRRNDVSIYWSCPHERLTLAKAGPLIALNGCHSPTNECCDEKCTQRAQRIYELFRKGTLPDDVAASEMFTCTMVCSNMYYDEKPRWVQNRENYGSWQRSSPEEATPTNESNRDACDDGGVDNDNDGDAQETQESHADNTSEDAAPESTKQLQPMGTRVPRNRLVNAPLPNVPGIKQIQSSHRRDGGQANYGRHQERRRTCHSVDARRPGVRF